MLNRLFLIVLDSLGAGEAPDAAAYGDVGSHTLRAICRTPGFSIENLRALGIGNIDRSTVGSEKVLADEKFAAVCQSIHRGNRIRIANGNTKPAARAVASLINQCKQFFILLVGQVRNRQAYRSNDMLAVIAPLCTDTRWNLPQIVPETTTVTTPGLVATAPVSASCVKVAAGITSS